MITATVLSNVKNRLNLTTSEFDSLLEDFFRTVVASRFNPKVLKEVAKQTVSVAPDDYGEVEVNLSTLSTPLTDVRMVESSYGRQWEPADQIYRHGTTLRVRGLTNLVNSLAIYGLLPYSVTSTGGEGGVPGTDLPNRYEEAVYWFIMASFYDYLCGNKSKFNIYMQTNGGNAIDDLRAEADYYENKAIAAVDENAQLYGSQ